jgi:hypothetical protein
VSAQNLPFVPPAPPVYEKDLPLWRFLWTLTRSTLAIWPNRAFETLTAKNRIAGLEFLIANDPEAVRHVLTTTKYNFLFDGGTGAFVCLFPPWTAGRRETCPCL